MKKREIRSAIKTVYQELWELLSLFEETVFFISFRKVKKGKKKLMGMPHESTWIRG